MRVIKFRAWNGKKFVEVVTYNFEKQLVNGDLINPPIVQYTGLKDKNGTEIYEGDIVEIINHRFEIISVLDIGGLMSEGYDFSRCEVIGNIYENKELLK